MVNRGSSKSTKEHERISGNVVIANVSMSGASLSASVSGQPVTISGNTVFAYISGGGMSADVSGSAVTISGDFVDISGSSLFVYISGGGISADVSGSAVTISGDVVYTSISGNAVDLVVSGGVLYTSTSISGNAVDLVVSGGIIYTVTSISGNEIINSVSGNVVYVTPSASDYAFQWTSDGGAVEISSIVTAGGTSLEWVSFHMTSGAATSSEFYITTMQISNEVYKTKIISVNPDTTSAYDIFYQPDNRLVLMSGATVMVMYSNPDARSYGCEMMFSDWG
jgi:hypothetical protein